VHPLIHDFVADVAAAIELPDPIVEFGSLQVEPGQDADLRPLFPGRSYTGTDMREGPGVDRVEDLRSLTLADGEVGTAICLETLEHCADPPTACRELARVVADGGVCIVSTPLLLGIHAHPEDYFRFTPSALESMLGGFDDVWVGSFGAPELPQWVFAVAAKRPRLGLSLEQLPRLRHAQEDYERAAGKFRIGPFQLGPRELVRSILRQLPRVARENVSRRHQSGE
jgi:SAM-dependent methyltransferase